MRPILSVVLFATALTTAFAAEVPPAPAGDLRVERTPSGVRYAILGTKGTEPAPTLLVFQGNIDVALREPIYTAVARILVRRGFIGIVIDGPAHGEDARKGEPAELAGWRARIDRGEDLLADFQHRVRTVLDHLIEQRVADPARIAACGTSRGGFLAFHVAAADPRIRFAAGFSPVADLLKLREFNGTTAPERAEALALVNLAPKLAGRPCWISIGNNDERVGTDATIAFGRALVKAAPPGTEVVPVDLIVHASPGHRSSVRYHELLAAWFLERFGMTP